MIQTKISLEKYLKESAFDYRELEGSVSFFKALRAFVDEPQIIAWGGARSPYAGIALEWIEKDWNQLKDQPICPNPLPTGPDQPFLGGYVGIVPYEVFTPLPNSSRIRVFYVKRLLLFDQNFQRAFVVEHSSSEEGSRKLNLERVFEVGDTSSAVWTATWRSRWEDEHYLSILSKCLEDIKNGRYYQINLLRYYYLQELISNEAWLARLEKNGGPFSVWLREKDIELISFSPERFVRFWSEDASKLKVVSEPIKGTISVSKDPKQDAKNRLLLQESSKDHAELHMIVDLMRNDLYRVCEPESLRVEESGLLHSFQLVHHLIARVAGTLRSGISLGNFLESICPGGSITGAPKLEVISAIKTYEATSRNYLMGNFFMWSPLQALFDSSILIRTAQNIAQQGFEFAAGSGIVIHSQPLEELQEVKVKAAVVVDHS